MEELVIYLVLIAMVIAILAYADMKVRRRALIFVMLGFVVASILMKVAEVDQLPQLYLFAQVLEGVSIISLCGIFFFRVLLPSIGFVLPMILQDVVIFVAYSVWILITIGVNPSNIFTTSAVLTAIIGFSMQDTLGNIISGLSLQLDHSVQKGDWIKIDDMTGRVIEIRWRYAAIETRNWETVLVPNSILMKNKFLVLGRRQGAPNQWRRWVWFNVDFRTPPQKVIEIVGNAIGLAQIEGVAKSPEPNCIIMDFTESYGRYAVRYWLTDLVADDKTDSQVRMHIYAALNRHSIRLSIPAYALFVTQEDAERKAVKATQSLDERRAAIQCVDLFSSLHSNELEELAKHLIFTPFAKGDIMTRQGAEAHWLYIIVSGYAEVILQTDSGENRKVASLEAGSFFGEMGLMTGEPRAASVIAGTDVICYRLDKQSFKKVIRARPSIAEELSQILAKRRADLDAAVENLNAEMKASRVSIAQEDILKKIISLFGLEGED